MIDRHNFKDVFIMHNKQIECEIKYRFVSLFLEHMLKDKIITKNEWILFKKKLIKNIIPLFVYWKKSMKKIIKEITPIKKK